MCLTLTTADEEFKGQGEAPVVQEPITPQCVSDGSPAMFECVITGNPKPLIGWFHEVGVVENSPDFMQFYDEDNLCSLVIKETYPEDTGRYTVVAKNKFGTATCAADLVVVGKTGVKHNGTCVCVRKRDCFAFSCHVTLLAACSMVVLFCGLFTVQCSHSCMRSQLSFVRHVRLEYELGKLMVR